jgi:hypothetical protein
VTEVFTPRGNRAGRGPLQTSPESPRRVATHERRAGESAPMTPPVRDACERGEALRRAVFCPSKQRADCQSRDGKTRRTHKRFVSAFVVLTSDARSFQSSRDESTEPPVSEKTRLDEYELLAYFTRGTQYAPCVVCGEVFSF